jgi:multiple sugar transport system substrate-binding protein
MGGRLDRALSRRRVVGLLGAAVALPLLQACGTAGGGAEGQPSGQPGAAGPVTVKALYWSSSPEDHQVFVDVFKAFQDRNPTITVEFDDTPSDAFTQKATTMMAAGTPPDAMELHPSWVLNYIVSKQLIDVSDKAKTDKAAYLPAQLDFWTYQNKLFGMPYYSGPSFIFYNKSLFKKYGAKTPEEHEKAGTWTWQTLRDLAKQVSAGSGADRTFGWDAAADASNLQFYTCVPIWDNQGELVNKDETAWLVDSDPVLEVMQWHADMYLKEQSIPMPSDMQGISWIFRTGRVGMAWAGKFRSIELVNAEFEVGMAGTPKGKAGPINRDGPNATGLPAGSKHPDQSYLLARFIGSAEAAPAYLSSGRAVPVQKALLDSDAFKKALKPYERGEVYAQSAATVRAWRVPGKGPEAGRAFKAEWDKVLVGEQGVPAAMKAAKAAMDPLLKLR